MSKQTLVRDLIVVPKQIRKGDFVVRLTQGVADPQGISDTFVATEGLVQSFDEALNLVSSSLEHGKSQAAYLHGSFGSGKSHFMAVLSLLLDGHEAAWKKPELHPLRPKHGFVGKAKLMRLHFHMIGKASIESAIFAEYIKFVREHHPEADLPGLFADEELFQDAARYLGDLGDKKFFARLNKAGADVEEGDEHDGDLDEGDGDEDDDDDDESFGDYDADSGWSRERFEKAIASSDAGLRAELMTALVETYFAAFTNRGAYIDLDGGLKVLADHAAGLGYDGVVLFLDELILWLAHRAGESGWMHGEVQKMVKLVEAQDLDRKIPLISFIARQRNLAEMVGEEQAGAENARLNQSIKHWEDRFDSIVLEDKNLTAVIEKRVVRPKDDAAKQAMDGAFASLKTSAKGSWDTMMGSYDGKAFRQVYPFSPALVQTLVALSNVLRRSRTAIRLLNELLFEHIDDLAIGQAVQVGDLYDPLAGGEDPADGITKSRFLAAKRFYKNDLLPLIQEQYGTGSPERCQRMRPEHKTSVGCSNCAESACRGDNRLAKTLLLAALVPNVGPLRDLDVSRLVQLNHGSVRSMIPGTEVGKAEGRIREWATQLQQIRVTGAENPRVSVHLEGVSLKPIIAQAKAKDSPGARQGLLRRLLFEALRVDNATDLGKDEKIAFHKTQRPGHVRFANVRKLGADQLACDPTHDWRLIIDYPFDDEGFGPNDDSAVLDSYLEQGSGSWTLVWLPSFFSKKVNDQLGDLVAIDHILESRDTRGRFLGNLSPDDRHRAESDLESLQHQLRMRVTTAMEQAYGIRTDKEQDLDSTRLVAAHLRVLKPGVDVPIGAAPAFSEAKMRLVQELLGKRYPRHPRFSDSLTAKRIEDLLDHFRRLVDAPEQRLSVDKKKATELAGTLGELGLLRAADSAVLLVQDRMLQDVEKLRTQAGSERPTVGEVRRWIDPNGRMGLLADAEDLVVRCYAYWSRRTLMFGGKPYKRGASHKGGRGAIPDGVELEQPELPPEEDWHEALGVAGTLFGIALRSKALHPDNLKAFEAELEAAVAKVQRPAAQLPDLLAKRMQELGLSGAERLTTAQCARGLCDALEGLSAAAQVSKLAEFPLETSRNALGRHFPQASAVCALLDNDLLFGVFHQLQREQGQLEGATELLEEAATCLCQDELNRAAASTMRSLAEKGQLLLKGPSVAPPPPEPPPEPGVVTLLKRKLEASGATDALAALEAAMKDARAAVASGQDVKLRGEIIVSGRDKK